MGLVSVVLAALESSLASFVFRIRLNRVFLVFLATLMAVDLPPGVFFAERDNDEGVHVPSRASH
jgi:hypothetical protein